MAMQYASDYDTIYEKILKVVDYPVPEDQMLEIGKFVSDDSKTHSISKVGGKNDFLVFTDGLMSDVLKREEIIGYIWNFLNNWEVSIGNKSNSVECFEKMIGISDISSSAGRMNVLFEDHGLRGYIYYEDRKHYWKPRMEERWKEVNKDWLLDVVFEVDK